MVQCKYKCQNKEKFNGKPYCTCFNKLCEDIAFVCDENCQVYEDYKQLQDKETELIMTKADLCRGCKYSDGYKKLKQVLAEIKEYVISTIQQPISRRKILHIINKAKDGEE